MHPYENIFFNELIGGVYGAYKKNFPGNGNTYGNTYYQGVLWLNSHAIPNSKLALVTGLGQNISRSTLREDILFHNTYLSAYNQDGEYQMTQIIQGDPHRSTFSYLFAEKFLEPVYVISYDGVELFKLWKNDARHIKRGLDIHNEKEEKVDTKIDGENLSIRFNKIEKLKRLEFFFQNDKCDIPLSFAKIFLSIDDKEYQQVPQVANDFTENEIRGYKAKRIVLFTGEEAKYITISFPPHKECAIEDLSAKAFTFVNLGM
jgi:hypothetical protein